VPLSRLSSLYFSSFVFLFFISLLILRAAYIGPVELSTGPFCVTRSNLTHQLTDPTQPDPRQAAKFGPHPTPPNKGPYSLVVAYFYTQN